MLARRGVYIFGSFASRVKARWDNWDLKKVCIGHSRVALITLATFFGTYGIFGNPVAAAVCGFLAFVLGHGFIVSLLYEGKVRRKTADTQSYDDVVFVGGLLGLCVSVVAGFIVGITADSIHAGTGWWYAFASAGVVFNLYFLWNAMTESWHFVRGLSHWRVFGLTSAWYVALYCLVFSFLFGFSSQWLWVILGTLIFAAPSLFKKLGEKIYAVMISAPASFLEEDRRIIEELEVNFHAFSSAAKDVPLLAEVVDWFEEFWERQLPLWLSRRRSLEAQVASVSGNIKKLKAIGDAVDEEEALLGKVRAASRALDRDFVKMNSFLLGQAFEAMNIKTRSGANQGNFEDIKKRADELRKALEEADSDQLADAIDALDKPKSRPRI